jgi:hypothetical protein
MPRRPQGRVIACLLAAVAAVALLAPAVEAQTYFAITLTVAAKCSDHGHCQITSKTTCDTAAAVVGLPSTWLVWCGTQLTAWHTTEYAGVFASVLLVVRATAFTFCAAADTHHNCVRSVAPCARITCTHASNRVGGD